MYLRKLFNIFVFFKVERLFSKFSERYSKNERKKEKHCSFSVFCFFLSGLNNLSETISTLSFTNFFFKKNKIVIATSRASWVLAFKGLKDSYLSARRDGKRPL